MFFKSVAVTESEAEFKDHDNVVLECGVDDNTKSYTFSWKKDGKTPAELKGSEDKWEATDLGNGSLLLKDVCEYMQWRFHFRFTQRLLHREHLLLYKETVVSCFLSRKQNNTVLYSFPG
jgi:hypothetical protein